MEQSTSDTVVLPLSGRVDIAALAALKEELTQAIAGGRTQLLLTMAAVSFIDSSGLGLLVGLQKELRGRGGGLALCEVPPQARMALRLTRLEWVLPCYDSVEEALVA